MSPRSSNPSHAVPEAHRARVLQQIDRAQRIAAMLDRWESDDVADEPDWDWDVNVVERLALRPHST
jgi:hypothetical protein